MSLHTALTKRYAAPQWALAFEVADATGYGKSRSADAVAMGLWPSRGLEVHGIEIKVSRADWLRELRDPEKSAAVQRYCDRWWLAVSDAEIVRDGELPSTWGLLVLQKGGKLITKVEAPALTAEPLSRGFVAAMVRAFSEDVTPTKEVTRIVNERVAEGVAHRVGIEEQYRKNAERERDEYLRQIQAFHDVSGVYIDRWIGAAKIGEAVRVVMSDPTLERSLSRASEELRELSQRFQAAVDEVRELRAKETPKEAADATG